MYENIVLGYSGHAFVVIDAALLCKQKVIGYSDFQKATINPYNLPYLGFEKDPAFDKWSEGKGFILGIGDNNIRDQAADLILQKNEILTTVIHPSSIIANNVQVGKGVFISSGAMINPLVELSTAVIINTGSIVEHECKIGKSSHIGPGAVLSGNVTVGEKTFVGANAVIKQGVKIGNNVTIGAGTVVLTDISDGAKIVGNPGYSI
jgi:sugar O-acyltransferase (sialic acid O-acetyltransferase NeuD family)